MFRSISKSFAVLSMAIALGATAACTGPTDTTTDAASADASSGNAESPKVALMLASLSTDFFVQIEAAATTYADEKGVELSVFNANNDAARELSIMEDVLSGGFDLILFTPVDSDAAVASVKLANDAGVPVITFDRGVTSGEVVTHVASDNEGGGAMAADFIAEQFPDGANVVELQGILATDVAKQRGGGFGAELAKAGNLEIVAQQSANFDKAEGYTVFENILQANDKVDAVFAHNDEMALGAMEAARAAGRTDILIVGFDASADAVQAVKDGGMAATVAQLPDQIIQAAIDAAIAYLAGDAVEPQIAVALELVTK